MRTILVAVIALAACGPKPPPVGPGPVPPSGEICSTSLLVLPTSSDVCADSSGTYFTSDGWACVQCDGVGECMDTIDGVYCVQGSCLADPYCSKHWGRARLRSGK